MKGKKIYNKLFLASIISVLILVPMTQANTYISTINDNVIDSTAFSFSFSEEEITISSLFNYDLIEITEGDFRNDNPGEPMLPLKAVKIALPTGFRATGVNILDYEKVKIPGKFNILPVQQSYRLNEFEENIEFIEPRNDIYSSNDPYPSELVEIIHQSDIAGQALAELRINPVQYLPKGKELNLFSSISFEIEGEYDYVCGDYLSEVASEHTIRTYERFIKSMVINDEDVNLNVNLDNEYVTASLPPGGPYEHVIITTDEFDSYWEPLVEWNTRKGFRDTVVTTSYIYSNYGGSNNQDRIRNFVIDAYNNWGTIYFLIGGEHADVPFKYKYYNGDNIPSDQHYGDFDDDWDYEVFIGRATAESSSQINTFIQKVLKYEKDPPLTDYPLDVLLSGMDVTTYAHDGYLTRGENLKEAIDNDYIPSRFIVTEVYDTDSSNHYTDFINALNDGQNLVNHYDHSWYTVMGVGSRNHGWHIDRSDVNDLTNDGKMSVIYSIGCHPNEMDKNDCIAERFVIFNDLQAGVAFTGNTRSGWFTVGQPDSLSGRLDRYWWRGLFWEGSHRLGETLSWTKNQCSHSSNTWKYCQWTLNLLGEPSMLIWTDTPSNLDVTHPTDVPTGPTVINVHVEEGGSPLQDAYVCLWKGDEIYETSYTSSIGDAAFFVTPTIIEDILVTVTKENYLPYESSIDVVPAPGQPYVPTGPIPSDEELLINTGGVTLEWSAEDPDGDPLTFDVYFGSIISPELVASGITEEYYDLPILEYDTTYLWYIVADDGISTYPSNSPIWSFRISQENYVMVQNPVVESGAQDVTINVYGRWNFPIGAYQFVLEYDPDILTVDHVDFTDTIAADAPYKLPGTDFPEGNINPGAIWQPASDGPDPGYGILCKVIVDISGSALNGDSLLHLIEAWPDPLDGPSKTKYTDQSGFGIYPERIDGKLTIVDQICGDANGDGGVDIDDVVYLISYIFSGGPAPVPEECVGNANGMGEVDIDDVVYLISYIFTGGPAPVDYCCS